MVVNNVDFEGDLKKGTLDSLEKYAVKFKKSDDLSHLLKKLFAFERKYIPPRAYCVKCSKELLEKLPELPQANVEAVWKLKKWLEEGIDVNCFQGRGLRGGGSRDYLNMEFGMIHLHLSASNSDTVPVIKKNGFSKTSAYILIAKVKSNHVYFIDALEHPAAFEGNTSQLGSSEKWLAEKFVSIVNDNWPELLSPRPVMNAKLCDEAGNEVVLDDAMRRELAINGINTGVQLKNGVYFPDGITGAKTSAAVSIRVDRTLNTLTRAKLYYAKNASQIISTFSMIAISNGKVIEELDLHYGFVQWANRYMIIDTVNGLYLDFDQKTVYPV